MCANNAYPSQAQTKRDVAEILRTNSFTVDTLMMHMMGTNPTASAVISAITSGYGILNYRGEGWTKGWDAYDVGIATDKNLSGINNVNMPTFITSIGCGVWQLG